MRRNKFAERLQAFVERAKYNNDGNNLNMSQTFMLHIHPTHISRLKHIYMWMLFSVKYFMSTPLLLLVLLVCKMDDSILASYDTLYDIVNGKKGWIEWKYIICMCVCLNKNFFLDDHKLNGLELPSATWSERCLLLEVDD